MKIILLKSNLLKLVADYDKNNTSFLEASSLRSVMLLFLATSQPTSQIFLQMVCEYTAKRVGQKLNFISYNQPLILKISGLNLNSPLRIPQVH